MDQGRKLGEQFARIGMYLAGLAGFVAPMSLLTGYFGMNVQELVPGTNGTLFDFWKIGAPVLILSASCIIVVAIWMMTDSRRLGGKN